MNDVRKLFENWMKQEFAWELKRTMHLRHTDDIEYGEGGYSGHEDQYIHVEVQKHYRAFKAAITIMGEMK